MKKTVFIIGEILAVLLCIVFLPVFIILCICEGGGSRSGKPVGLSHPTPISVDKIKKAKILIEASSSVEEINEVLEDYLGLKHYEHKIEFLKNNFNVEVFDKQEGDSLEFEFELIANHILNMQIC